MNRILKITIYALTTFLVLILIGVVYFVIVATDHPPKITNLNSLDFKRVKIDVNCYTIDKNWIRKSESGLWEMYVEGKPFERGVINGKLSRELIESQEEAFHQQINKLVPSSFYRHFLKYFIAWFNRDLDDNIIEEYKEEIYGISQSASEKYDFIGLPYQRLLNYHAAHDIGHALQNMALVGCSSFATWNQKSEDNLLIIGRNFDFYVSDKFAENKIVEFINPDSGNQFMMISWGGMIGVVSGMNIEGLTITLNAGKSDIPSGSATPVSLLAREILQYASTINEAIQIASSRKTFVSESFLIGSALDNKAIIIEKTPEKTDVFSSGLDYLICTNHFQAKSFLNDSKNVTQINESASNYRFLRINELLNSVTKNTVQNTINILRDRRGIHNQNIGLGNEKAINQLICHHSLVFEPQKKRVWISTGPWQLGKYVAYDLNKIFSMSGLTRNIELYDSSLTISPDTFLINKEYKEFMSFRLMKSAVLDNREVDITKMVASNPYYYYTYVLAGNYLFKKEKYADAEKYYRLALEKEIATAGEEKYIRKQLEICQTKKPG